MSALSYTSITRETFDNTLSRYSSTAPEKLRELDTLRYGTIPATLLKRKQDSEAYLKKNEVEKLVEWKLKHGTFRPKLLQLVQSNEALLIEDTTRKAFSNDADDVAAAVKTLTGLKGIGPATASLLLSVYAPESVPFFSDELFRWTMWDEKGVPGGWKRIIKYNNKEYEQLVQRVRELAERLDVSAVDAERVAWVLGHEGVDVEKGNDEGKKATPAKRTQSSEADSKKVIKKSMPATKVKEPQKGVKRKAGETKPPIEGTRRSSRRKTET